MAPGLLYPPQRLSTHAERTWSGRSPLFG